MDTNMSPDENVSRNMEINWNTKVENEGESIPLFSRCVQRIGLNAPFFLLHLHSFPCVSSFTSPCI